MTVTGALKLTPNTYLVRVCNKHDELVPISDDKNSPSSGTCRGCCVEAINKEAEGDKQEDATVTTQKQTEKEYPIHLIHEINYQRMGKKTIRKTAIHYVETGDVDSVRRLVQSGRDLAQECKVCHDYDVHHGWMKTQDPGPQPLTPTSTSSTSSKGSSSSKRSASSSSGRDSTKSRKTKEITIGTILEGRIIQVLSASRKIAAEDHTVPCINGIVLPSQPGKSNYDNPEEMVQHMTQALKHQKEQIARDKKVVDHLHIALREILEKPKIRPEQKLDKALELFGRISNDRFMLKQINVYDLTVGRIVTPLMNSIIDTMTHDTKQMMNQARQNRQESYGSTLPPPLPDGTEFLPNFDLNDFSGQDTQSCTSSSSWRSAEPPPLPNMVGPPPLPGEVIASTEGRTTVVLKQPEIEVEVNTETHAEIDYEPMTPVPMMNDELMSPMGDDDHVEIGDFSRQLDQLTTANQEALQDLQIEERKK